jgi:phage terminase small subunit
MQIEKFKNRADKYIATIEKSIKRDYGEVPPEWEAQLQQLHDLYLMYLKAADMAKEEDPTIKINSGRTLSPNLNFGIMVQCTNSMDKILKQFGLNPVAQKKLKGEKKPAEAEDFMDEL